MDRKRRTRAHSLAKEVVASVEKFLQWLGRPVYIISLGTCIALLLLVVRILAFIKNIVLLIFRSVIPDVVRNLYKLIRLPKLLAFHFPAFPRFPTIKLPQLPSIKLPHIELRKKLIGGLIFIFLLLTSYSLLLIFHNLPSPSDLRNHRPKLTTHILDRNGDELYKIYKEENRSLTTLDQLPTYVIDATVAIEDKDFWNHPGFSLTGMVRAGIHNIQSSTISLQGGSTITQQLIKNTILSPEKTVTRKIRELVLAVWIERAFTKKEILEMYLNDVSYGGTAYGIQEAAQQYFGEDAGKLTLGEATLLAGLPAAPTSYSPLGSHPERAYERQSEVLRRMVEDKYISQDEANKAAEEKIELSDGSDIKAPHFVMVVRDLLVEKFGEAMVNHGGLKVTTTLDLPTQDFVQQTVTGEVNKLARLRVSNGAALVTNPKNGDILAMVGSKNYFDFKHDGQVNVTMRPRQPGSSIKPVNYAAALQRGFTPASVILDAPISFPNPGSKPYTPVNYDGKFHGPVPLRTALGSSYNVPAVKVLSTIGVDTMIDQGEKMGIKTWRDRKRFGLSLTLGGGEITMADMAEMYGTLANYGMHVPLNPILKIEDSQGKVLYEKNQINRQIDKQTNGQIDTDSLSDRQLIQLSDHPFVSSAPSHALPAGVAYQLTSILSDPAARAPAFGTHSVLNIPIHQVAVKTGTTNSLRDNWTFGYTTDLVVSTWVGNNDNSPMSYIASGITGASPIWAIIMKGLLADRTTPHAFPKPADLVTVKICSFTGQLPCEGCPTKEEIFLPGTEPTQACRPETIQEIKNRQQELEKQRDQILQGASTQR